MAIQECQTPSGVFLPFSVLSAWKRPWGKPCVLSASDIEMIPVCHPLLTLGICSKYEVAKLKML